MKRCIPVMLAVLLLFGWTAVLAADGADGSSILGVWYNQEKDAKIEISKCGEKYCGKIVWVKNPNYPEDSKEGIPGTPRLDNHNPDPDLRKRPILGLEIVKGFTYDGDSEWTGGRVYDPKSGNTYRGKMTLDSPDRLNLRGYIIIPLFGRTAVWTRAESKD